MPDETRRHAPDGGVDPAIVEALFRPRSIAVIGASETPGKRGHTLITNLRDIGYRGRIYPVNPARTTVLGERCWPGVSALPEVPGVAAICLPAAAVPDALRASGAAGIRAAAVVSAAFADAGPAGVRLQDELLAVARAHGMGVMGPNGLGILNRLERVQYWIGRPPGAAYRDATPSGIAAIVQSGSMSMSIAVDALERGLAFDYIVSAGNQSSLDVAAYLDWLLDDERARPRAIGLVVEGIGDAVRFAAAARRAFARGVAIVALKLGRSAATREFITSHTGAMVGSAEVADRAFERLGVIGVGDADEWLEQLVLMAHPNRPAGGRWVMITTSGGGNAAIADLAQEIGLERPVVPAHTVGVMQRIGDRPVLNPIDAGGYYDAPNRYRTAVTGALADPEVDAVLACVAWYPQPGEPSHELFDSALDAAREARKPVLVHSFAAGPVGEVARARLRSAGLYALKGSRNTLLALKRHLWWCDRSQIENPDATADACDESPSDYGDQSGTPGPLEPERARALLADAGLAVPDWRAITSPEQARAAAEEMGLPLVMKVDHARLAHKTEHGAVVTNLGRSDAILACYQRMKTEVLPVIGRRDARLILQRQIIGGLELLLAARNDPVFGPYVVVGMGGIEAELLRDYTLRPCPVGVDEAQVMLSELRGYPLLNGYRSRPAFDIGAVCAAIHCLARLAERLGPRLETIEINPLIVTPGHGGAWCADVTATLAEEDGGSQ